MEVKINVYSDESAILTRTIENAEMFTYQPNCTYKAEQQLFQIFQLARNLAREVMKQSEKETRDGDFNIGVHSDLDISLMKTLAEFDIPPYDKMRKKK